MKTKVLFLHKCFVKGGGIERVHQNLASAFTAKNISHSFFVHNGYGESENGFASLSKNNDAVRAPESASFITKLNCLFENIKRQNITAIIAATETANLMAFFCKLRFPFLRVVYTRHCAFDVSDQKLSPWAIKMLYSLYLTNGNVVAVSNALKEQIYACALWGKKSVHFIPNAVISEKLLEQANSDLELVPTDDYFVAVGRLVEQKGFDLLLPAYAKAYKENRLLPKLVIAGEGEDGSELKALAEALKISDAVTFLGFVSNPYCLIKSARAFVLSSRHEGMPTVLVEAMALDTPVIAFDCPTGPNELIVNGENGALIRYLDIDELSNALLNYESLPHKNLSNTVAHFSYSEVASNYLSFCGATA